MQKRKIKSDSAVKAQVSIIGPGASHIPAKLARRMTEDFLDGHTHDRYQVRIKLWRSGEELDWQADNPRAENLRKLIRGQLQSGAVTFRKVGRQ